MLELQVDGGFDQAHIDAPAFASHAPAHQQGKDALHQLRARHHVGDGQPGGDGRSVAIPRQPGDARQRLDQQVLPRPVAPWSFRAITTDPGIDEARIDGADLIPAQPQPVHDAGAKIVDQHIGARHQPQHHRQIVGVLQVGGQALLAPVDGMKQRAVPIERQVGKVEIAAGVAAVGPFHLDDPRAQIAQPQCCRRSSQKLAEIQDRHAFQGKGHRSIAVAR